MAKPEIGIPILDAVVTYSVRDTGGSWSTAAPMDGGVIHPRRTFSFPVCDEIKIEVALTNSQSARLIFLSGLNLSGLHFEVKTGDPLVQRVDVDQSVETIVRRKFRQVLSWSAVATDNIELIITGIGQQILDVEQIGFFADFWQPAVSFDGDQPNKIGATFYRQVSRGSALQKINSKLREFNLFFPKLTEAESDDIDHIISERLTGGFCLVQLNPDITTGKYNFFASVAFAEGEAQQYSGTNERVLITALEAYER